jgi:hypothetical protein
MRTHWAGEDGHLIKIDENTPARILARSEPMHEADGDDWDRDLAPDDAPETFDAAAIKNIPRDALKVILRFIIPSTSSSEAKRWRIAQLRVALLAHMLDIDGIGSKSFQQLGDELGCTRALLSLYSLRLIDGLTIDKTRNGKCRRSREVYRQTATEAHRRQGHRMKQDVAQGV